MPREVNGLETAEIGDEVEAIKNFDYDGMTIKKGERGTVIDRSGDRELTDAGDEVHIILYEHHCELHSWNNKILIHVGDADVFPMKVVYRRSARAA